MTIDAGDPFPSDLIMIPLGSLVGLDTTIVFDTLFGSAGSTVVYDPFFVGTYSVGISVRPESNNYLVTFDIGSLTQRCPATLTLLGDISNDRVLPDEFLYLSDDQINSSANINSGVVRFSSSNTALNEGFEVREGAVLLVDMNGCER